MPRTCGWSSTKSLRRAYRATFEVFTAFLELVYTESHFCTIEIERKCGSINYKNAIAVDVT
jgi:hypothetical protein